MQQASKMKRAVALGVALVLGLAAAISVATSTFARDAYALTAATKLSELAVRPEGSLAGYSRDLYPHWSNAQDYGWKIPAGTPDPGSCDTREAALIRDGTREHVGSGCTVSTGRWFDPYTGHVYYRSSDMDADHIVALAESYQSGSKGWSRARKEAFANSPVEVMMVEDNANASKGDRDPAEWKPPRQAYWCTYARKWVSIKYRWDLSVDRAEKKALASMLGAC